MKLLALQRVMARAVMQPLTASEHMSEVSPAGGSMARFVERFIKPNDRLTAFERLEIYNKQYWFRLLSSLMDDFPGLQAILGERKFAALCKAYLQACPSRSFTLRNLGRSLEYWLSRHPQWAGARHTMAVDMVRLEWADIEAFDGQAEPVWKLDRSAAALGPKLKLRLQPYIRLLQLRYPVDDLVLEVKKFDRDTQFLSNAFRERRKRARVRATARLKPASIYLAVHRMDYSVYFRRLARGEFLLLRSIQDGHTLGQAITRCFSAKSRGPQPPPEEISAWFKHWADLGWFCAPREKKPRS